MVAGRMPSDCAACTIPREICVSAACVLRTIGSSAYNASAIYAGTAPMRPVSGIRTASSASDGMVCTRPVAPMIQLSSAGRFAGENSERDADRDAGRERKKDEPQLL
jgi:hypothetical protein